MNDQVRLTFHFGGPALHVWLAADSAVACLHVADVLMRQGARAISLTLYRGYAVGQFDWHPPTFPLALTNIEIGHLNYLRLLEDAPGAVTARRPETLTPEAVRDLAHLGYVVTLRAQFAGDPGAAHITREGREALRRALAS